MDTEQLVTLYAAAMGAKQANGFSDDPNRYCLDGGDAFYIDLSFITKCLEMTKECQKCHGKQVYFMSLPVDCPTCFSKGPEKGKRYLIDRKKYYEALYRKANKTRSSVLYDRNGRIIISLEKILAIHNTTINQRVEAIVTAWRKHE